MTAAFAEQINDPDSPLVRAAMARKCACGAEVDEPCQSCIKGQTALPGRLVHYARTSP